MQKQIAAEEEPEAGQVSRTWGGERLAERKHERERGRDTGRERERKGKEGDCLILLYEVR